jgi:hypothetical protein
MENLFFLLATSFASRFITPRKFKVQVIGNTGCSALLFSDSGLECTKTESGDQFYFYESVQKDVTYGMICIHLQEDYSMPDAVEMLNSYITKLKGPFYILHTTGLRQIADWNSATTTVFTDYWQDSNQEDWKIKGYTNGKVLAILYVKNIGHAATEKHELFLDSFHFTGSC